MLHHAATIILHPRPHDAIPQSLSKDGSEALYGHAHVRGLWEILKHLIAFWESWRASEVFCKKKKKKKVANAVIFFFFLHFAFCY